MYRMRRYVLLSGQAVEGESELVVAASALAQIAVISKRCFEAAAAVAQETEKQVHPVAADQFFATFQVGMKRAFGVVIAQVDVFLSFVLQVGRAGLAVECL